MLRERKRSISDVLRSVKYLPNRTPMMAIEGGAERAFARISDYRDGAIYVGHYSGNSEWERHSSGDEIVMTLEGSTTIVLRIDGYDERIELSSGDIVVVPRNTWHRFENSTELKVFTVTPQPTDHAVDDPGA